MVFSAVSFVASLMLELFEGRLEHFLEIAKKSPSCESPTDRMFRLASPPGCNIRLTVYLYEMVVHHLRTAGECRGHAKR
jgi:hypothetical protein